MVPIHHMLASTPGAEPLLGLQVHHYQHEHHDTLSSPRKKKRSALNEFDTDNSYDYHYEYDPALPANSYDIGVGMQGAKHNSQAYVVPTVGVDIGGIGTIVGNGQNGNNITGSGEHMSMEYSVDHLNTYGPGSGYGIMDDDEENNMHIGSAMQLAMSLEPALNANGKPAKGRGSGKSRSSSGTEKEKKPRGSKGRGTTKDGEGSSVSGKASVVKTQKVKVKGEGRGSGSSVAAGAVAVVGKEGKGGSSCHQCKSRRSLDALLHCSLNTDKQKKKCRKKFCGQCLKKFYNGAELIGKAVCNWKCPSCRNICCCAACRRRREKDGEGSKDDGPNGIVGSAAHVKKIQKQQQKFMKQQKEDKKLLKQLQKNQSQKFKKYPLDSGDEVGEEIIGVDMKMLPDLDQDEGDDEEDSECDYEDFGNTPSMKQHASNNGMNIALNADSDIVNSPIMNISNLSFGELEFVHPDPHSPSGPQATGPASNIMGWSLDSHMRSFNPAEQNSGLLTQMGAIKPISSKKRRVSPPPAAEQETMMHSHENHEAKIVGLDMAAEASRAINNDMIMSATASEPLASASSDAGSETINGTVTNRQRASATHVKLRATGLPPRAPTGNSTSTVSTSGTPQMSGMEEPPQSPLPPLMNSCHLLPTTNQLQTPSPIVNVITMGGNAVSSPLGLSYHQGLAFAEFEL